MNYLDHSIYQPETAIVGAADWMEFQSLPAAEKSVWLEQKWREHFAAIGVEPPAWWESLPETPEPAPDHEPTGAEIEAAFIEAMTDRDTPRRVDLGPWNEVA